MNIACTLNGQVISVTPFELKNDTHYTLWDANYGDYYAGGAFYSFINEGSIVKLKPIFKELWQEKRRAGTYWNETGFPCHTVFTVSGSYNGQNFTQYFSYRLKYDPATPTVLYLTWQGQNLNQALLNTFTELTTELHFENSDDANYECLTIAAIKQANTTLPTLGETDLEGSYTIITGCGGYLLNQVTHNWVHIVDPGGTDYGWEDQTQNTWSSVPLSDCLQADLDCYEIYDRAVNYYSASESGTQWQGGYTSFNNFLIEGLLVDGEPWSISEDNDSQDDDSDINNFSKSYNDVSEYIPYDGVPVNSALDTNFIHAYMATASQLQALSDFMLSDDFIDKVKKLFDQPMDYILSLMMLPLRPPATTLTTVKIGGVDTEKQAFALTQQWLEFDCGKVDVTGMWGGFLDFGDNTRIKIFVPFVGERDLDVNEVMQGELHLRYRIDMLTGCFVATLHVHNTRGFNVECYHWLGQMGYNIPMTMTNYMQKVQALLNLAGTGIGLASGAPVNVSSLGNDVLGVLKSPHIDRAGTISGDGAILDNYTPYIIVERPVQQKPKYFDSLNGYMSEVGGLLSDFSGYLEVESIDLSGLNCTDDEKEEILNDLKSGVFV